MRHPLEPFYMSLISILKFVSISKYTVMYKLLIKCVLIFLKGGNNGSRNPKN